MSAIPKATEDDDDDAGHPMMFMRGRWRYLLVKLDKKNEPRRPTSQGKKQGNK